MDKQDAFFVLGVKSDASPDEIQSAYQQKKLSLEERLNSAPDTLKAKFSKNLEQLAAAFGVAEESTETAVNIDINDLPVAKKHVEDNAGSGIRAALNSKYQVTETLDSSANSQSFLGEPRRGGDAVFLKTYELELSKSAQAKIEQQLELYQRIQHANLQVLLEYAVLPAGVWLCFETLPDSAETLKKEKISKPQDMIAYFRHACDITNYLALESGHGNLNPETLYVDNNAPFITALHIDGLSERSPKTEPYRAPELKRGSSDALKSDQYSIAVMILEMMVGGAFSTGGVAAALLDKRLNEASKLCFQKALNSNPSQRYANAELFLDALEESFVSTLDKLKRNPVVIVPTVLILVVLVLGIVFKSQVVEVYDENVPDLASDVDYQTLAIKQLAASKELIIRFETFIHQLTRDESKLSSQLARLQRSSANASSKEKKSLLTQINSLKAQREYLNEKKLGVDWLSDIKSTVVVISQLVSSKSYEKALEYNEKPYEQLTSTKALISILPEIVSNTSEINYLQLAVAKLTDREHLSEEFIQTEQSLLSAETELLAAHNYAPLIQEVYSPLVNLYQQKLKVARNAMAAKAQKLANKFLASVNDLMVRIEPKTYKMGLVKAGAIDARPVHKVNLNPFSVSKFPVTNSLYNEFLRRNNRNKERVTGKNQYPVVNISWGDAKQFTEWLSRFSGQHYRLLSESEWEYIAKGATKKTFAWGNSAGKNNANCANCGSPWDNQSASPVGSFKENQYGVFDINGNVWEWVQDCYVDSYTRAPNDGSAVEFSDCEVKVVRGGAWDTPKKKLHPALRSAALPITKLPSLGFRLARDN